MLLLTFGILLVTLAPSNEASSQGGVFPSRQRIYKTHQECSSITNSTINLTPPTTMLDQEVEVSGWHAAWINRTMPAFQYYTNTVSYTLAFTIVALGLLGFIGIRRCTKELKANPDDRPAIFKKINKRVLHVCRGHWMVANIYMLNVLIIALVDAYIGARAIGKDVSEQPENWTRGAILEIAAYCFYLVAVFSFTFVVVPLAQMFLVTWLLARFARKQGISTLAEYIPEARMYSTYIAQLWTMVCFFVVAWWVPVDNSFWRYVVLQAAMGSAVAWLDASFAFNFCAEKLAEKDLELSTGGVREIVKLFGKTVRVTHTWEKKGDVLPRYEVVAQVDDSEALHEKEAET